MDLFSVIKRQISTEKTNAMGGDGRYGFLVDPRAGKRLVREAVERLYGVRVASVRTAVLPGKLKRAGKKVKKTSRTKKAYVRLRKGDKIEPFEGV